MSKTQTKNPSPTTIRVSKSVSESSNEDAKAKMLKVYSVCYLPMDTHVDLLAMMESLAKIQNLPLKTIRKTTILSLTEL